VINQGSQRQNSPKYALFLTTDGHLSMGAAVMTSEHASQLKGRGAKRGQTRQLPAQQAEARS